MKHAIVVAMLIVVMCLMITIATTYQMDQVITLRLFDSQNEPGFLWRNIIFAVAMLAGIILGHLYTFITAEQAQTIDRTMLKNAFADKRLWLSLLASPLIFGLVYVLNEHQPSSVMASLLAFENGFFCNAILKSKLKEHDTGAV